MSDDALNLIHAQYQDAHNSLRRALADQRDAEERVTRLQGEISGLRKLMIKLQEATPMDVQKARVVRTRFNGQVDWDKFSRSKAVLEMLRQRGAPMTPAQLSAALKNVGRERDEPNYISSTLDFLKKRGRVRPLGEGQWALADQEGPGAPQVESLLEKGGES